MFDESEDGSRDIGIDFECNEEIKGGIKIVVLYIECHQVISCHVYEYCEHDCNALVSIVEYIAILGREFRWERVASTN